MGPRSLGVLRHEAQTDHNETKRETARMKIVEKQPLWRPLAIIGAILLIAVGLIALASPARASVDGEKITCGSSFSRNNTAAENHMISRSADEITDRLLGYKYRSRTTDNAFDECSDSITKRRLIGWPLAISGIALVAYVLLTKRGRTRKPPLAEADTTAGAGGADTATLLPGWYPDQTDPALLRWFDGSLWTEATLRKQPGQSASP
jgi:hypothetical protein